MSLQAKLKAATFDDIVTDQVAINRFTNARDRLTRLRSVAGVVIKDIPVDLLRILVGVSRLNLGSPTEMKKADMKKGDYCEFIGTKVQEYQIAKANGTLATMYNPAPTIVTVRKWNIIRLIKCLLCEAMHSILDKRNGSLTREELNDQKRTGQTFHEWLMVLYHDLSQFKKSAYPDIYNDPLDTICGTYQ
ncbi:unnamed protein product [Cylindrotheca closterium]|uniref:Uncharacterized protein n=1 Tax=Cylindrotheca closterium TaxID=2856 RepID=A0AAD2CLG3_9STRA|nr:unnamed protein product [Cylindrotheca closterium]